MNQSPPTPPAWSAYGAALLVVAACTALDWALADRLDLANLVMVYLTGVAAVSARFGTGPSVLASLAGVLAFDFFFVPPRFTLAVADGQHLFTFLVMLAVGLAISQLTARVRRQAALVREVDVERMRSSLLSAVSHDLRTPLAAITGSAGTLLAGDADLGAAGRRDLVENIRGEAARLDALVNNLLEMTRLDAAVVTLRKEPHDVEDVVGAALGRFEERLADRPVTTDIAGDLPLVPMDAFLVEQLLVNLLENALRHAPGTAPIMIRARTAGGRLILAVGDGGAGIPPDELPRLFDKFYRGRGAGTGGAGLGLAICKAVAEAHGGAITAANRPEGGAEFTVTLPLGGAPV